MAQSLRVILILALLAGLAPPATLAAGAGQPLGPAYTVNTSTASAELPTVARNAAGAFVVAWNETVTSIADYTVKARLFDAAGNPRGDEFQVNQADAPIGNGPPALAMGADGGFVVAWPSIGGSNSGVYARRYAADGTPLSDELRISQPYPDVSALGLGGIFDLIPARPAGDVAVSTDPDGDFVVAWDEFPIGVAAACIEPYIPSCTFTSSSRVVARRYSAGGSRAEAAQQVDNAPAAASVILLPSRVEAGVAVAMAPDGGFAVAWNRANSLELGPYLRCYDANGAPLNPTAQRVSSNSAGSLSGAPVERTAVTANGAGNFAVVYSKGTRSGNSFGLPISVYARLYDARGQAKGAEFRADDGANSFPQGLAAAMDPGGDLVVLWGSDLDAATDVTSDIFGQRFAAGGVKLGGNFIPDTPGTQVYDSMPAVASDGAGNFVAVWQAGYDIPHQSQPYTIAARLYQGP